MTGASVEGQPVPLLCESDVNQGWAVVLFDMPAWLTESNYCLHGWQLTLPARHVLIQSFVTPDFICVGMAGMVAKNVFACLADLAPPSGNLRKWMAMHHTREGQT